MGNETINNDPVNATLFSINGNTNLRTGNNSGLGFNYSYSSESGYINLVSPSLNYTLFNISSYYEQPTDIPYDSASGTNIVDLLIADNIIRRNAYILSCNASTQTCATLATTFGGYNHREDIYFMTGQNNALYLSTQDRLIYSSNNGASWEVIDDKLSNLIPNQRYQFGDEYHIASNNLGNLYTFSRFRDYGGNNYVYITKYNQNSNSWSIVTKSPFTDTGNIYSLLSVDSHDNVFFAEKYQNSECITTGEKAGYVLSLVSYYVNGKWGSKTIKANLECSVDDGTYHLIQLNFDNSNNLYLTYEDSLSERSGSGNTKVVYVAENEILN